MLSNAVQLGGTLKGHPDGMVVTVVMTNYNHSRFLRGSVSSLFNQTRPAKARVRN
jgi:hypothetical protein